MKLAIVELTRVLILKTIFKSFTTFSFTTHLSNRLAVIQALIDCKMSQAVYFYQYALKLLGFHIDK